MKIECCEGGGYFSASLDIEITAKFKCKCGEEQTVAPEHEIEHGYYAGEASSMIKVTCKKCGACFEGSLY